MAAGVSVDDAIICGCYKRGTQIHKLIYGSPVLVLIN